MTIALALLTVLPTQQTYIVRHWSCTSLVRLSQPCSLRAWQISTFISWSLPGELRSLLKLLLSDKWLVLFQSLILFLMMRFVFILFYFIFLFFCYSLMTFLFVHFVILKENWLFYRVMLKNINIYWHLLLFVCCFYVKYVFR